MTGQTITNAPATAVLGRFPCSATQERCWFLDQLEPGNRALNVAIRWTITGRIDAAAIREAYRAVIARHEILRTRFASQDGRPMQEVMARAPFQLAEIDLRATPAHAHEARVDAISIEDAAKPFDLSRPGLIRAVLIRVANDRAILSTTIHQIAFDGWSIGVLGREVGAFAAAHMAGRRATLPELPLQYADYALWQAEYFASADFEAELAHWARKLSDAPYFELPADFPRPAQRTQNCDMVMADLPVAFGERLAAEAKALSMSPFAYGAGVLSALLARLAGESEVLFGTQVAGRIDVDLEPLIGVFINNVVLRFAVPDGALHAHLATSAVTVREALAHQSTPFNRLVELINPPRDPSRTPLISINYMLQNAFMQPADYGDFAMASAPSHAPGAIYDLNFQLVGRPTGWRMTVEYNTDLFAHETALDLIEAWQAAFAHAFDNAAAPVAEMPVPAAFANRLDAVGEAIGPIEAALCTHPLVEEAAALVVTGEDGAVHVHGFVTPSAQATMALETLPKLLLAHRPDPSDPWPDDVSVLRALPRDAAGRIARTRLRVPVREAPPEPRQPDDDAVNEVEAVLAAIWRDILGVEDVGPASNFFDLGGHSLLSVQMLARIQDVFDVKPSLSAVYTCPTLRAMASAIARQTGRQAGIRAGEDDWRIVPLSRGRGVTTVAINNVGILQKLCGTSAGDRHLFAVRMFEPGHAHGLEGLSFPEIAARYAALIRREAPSGPYVLFGECVHGVLCTEIARQLSEAGERVLLLATVNMWHPAYAARLTPRQRWKVRLSNVRDNFRLVLSGKKSFTRFLANYSITHRIGMWKAARALHLVKAIPPKIGTPEQEGFLRALLDARDVYTPTSSNLPILQMLTPDSPTGRGFDPTLGWSDVETGPFKVVPVRPFGSSEEQHPGLPAMTDVIADALVALDRAPASPGERP